MSTHSDVITKLEEVLELVKTLPQGYQYKVRELCACIETVVGMYDDIKKGIIPEIFHVPAAEEIPEERQKELDNDAPCVIIENTNEATLKLGNFEL